MGNFGIKIALPGQDALTVADKDLVFSSKYNTLKIVSKGTVNITTNGSGIGSTTIAHNLGFAPTFQVFRKGTADWRRNNKSSIDNNTYSNAYFPNPGNENNWIPYHAETKAYTDDTNLTISIIGANSTTYTFIYFIFMDLGVNFTGDSPLGSNDFGLKIAQPGKDAFDQKDYQLGFSSRFRPLQYNHVKSGTMTIALPALFGSKYSDSTPESAAYAEVTHGLGYPPFFLGFYKSSLESVAQESNNATQSALIDLGLGGLNSVYDSWCDATRIRFSFWRKAFYVADDSWSTETFTIKYLIFNEDLSVFT